MKKGMLKKIVAVLSVGVISISMVACGGTKSTGENKEGKNVLSEIKEKGELVVGLSADYAPYEFHAMIDGKDTVVGFDVEIAKEIAKDLGVNLKIKEMKFDSLLGALPAGQIDMIISGMNPDPARAKKVDFSDIYYKAEHGVLVRKENVDKYKTVDDLKNLKLGAQMGSTQADICKDVIGAKDVTLLSNVNNLILDLKTGKIDGLVVEKPVGKMAMANNKDVELSNLDFNDESGGNAVAVKKGEDELLKEVNKTINRLKESGDLDKFIVESNELAAKQIEK